MEVVEEQNYDEELYSRQCYILGDECMECLSKASVLLVGLGGVGAEIVKNLVLLGVKHLSICDDKPTSFADVGVNWFITNEDVSAGLTRSSSSCPKIQDLNPSVNVKAVSNPLTNLAHLSQYNLVILTETNLKTCIEVNLYCRSLNPAVKLIVADVFGVVSWLFCDFGPSFTTKDASGEEPRIGIIGDITCGPNGKVIVANNVLVTVNDEVEFTDIIGMEKLNGTRHKITSVVANAFTFEALTHTQNLGTYIRGGMFETVKQSKTILFKSLEDDLLDTVQFSQVPSSYYSHLAMLGLHKYLELHRNLPNIGSLQDAQNLFSIVKDLNTSGIEIKEDFIKKVSFAARGQLPSISAVIGGVCAQQTVIALTEKFTPVQQWFHFNATSLVSCDAYTSPDNYKPTGRRYDLVNSCLGKGTIERMADSNIFITGCGSVGCEMIKNLALLGVGSKKGKLTITDPKRIEKSNLNNQFLFQRCDIRKSKSATAAKSIMKINPDLNINAYQLKFGPETEDVFPESFLVLQNVIVNGLDNFQGRRYTDNRCVLAAKPFLDILNYNTKGNVTVVLPHLTDTYSSSFAISSQLRNNEYPYCTIKSFPSQLEHAAQWGKEKFLSLFQSKPSRSLKFLSNNDLSQVVQQLNLGVDVEDSFQVNKILSSRPTSVEDCLKIARLKFEKYFNHKAKHLLHFFPEDKVVENDKISMPFWHSPRRSPKPIVFDIENNLHITFVTSMAQLLAHAWNVSDTYEIDKPKTLLSIPIPAFQPKDNKVVVTDEAVVAPDPMEVDCADQDLSAIAKSILESCQNLEKKPGFIPIYFDKNIDSHLNFVYAATNLRAAMYKIPAASRAKVKQMTGNIVPSTIIETAVVCGLATIELIKILQQLKDRTDYNNWSVNMSNGSVLPTNPSKAEIMQLGRDIKYTIWDKFYIYGKRDLTLQQVLQMAQEKCKLKPSMLVQGTRIVWWPILPGHSSRVHKKFKEFIEVEGDPSFVDLSFTFEDDMENDYAVPIIRLVFQD